MGDKETNSELYINHHFLKVTLKLGICCPWHCWVSACVGIIQPDFNTSMFLITLVLFLLQYVKGLQWCVSKIAFKAKQKQAFVMILQSFWFITTGLHICAMMDIRCQFYTGGRSEMQPVKRCFTHKPTVSPSVAWHHGDKVLMVASCQGRADGCLQANKSWK